MKEVTGLMLLVALLALILAEPSWADDKKPPTCQEQLTEATVQAYNLDAARDQTERTLAKSQVTVYQLQNQIVLLQKQLADAKKAMETPKADEKKAE